MCLSTLYREEKGERREVMQNVARMEAEGDGFYITDLFGARRFLQGRIKSLDLSETHAIVMADR